MDQFAGSHSVSVIDAYPQAWCAVPAINSSIGGAPWHDLGVTLSHQSSHWLHLASHVDVVKLLAYDLPLRCRTTIAEPTPVGIGHLISTSVEVSQDETRRLVWKNSYLQPGRSRYGSVELTPPTRSAAELLALHEVWIDKELSQRYATLAGDPSPIHLDDEYALKAGLPGAIAHGMSIFLMAISFAQAALESRRGEPSLCLANAQCRFAKPVPLGSTVSFRVHSTDDANTVLVRAENARGAVLKATSVAFVSAPTFDS